MTKVKKNQKIKKTKVVYEKHSLCFRDAIINMIPFLVTLFACLLFAVVGINFIQEHYGGEPIAAMMTMVWFLVVWQLVKLIPFPKTTWEVRTQEVAE